MHAGRSPEGSTGRGASAGSAGNVAGRLRHVATVLAAAGVAIGTLALLGGTAAAAGVPGPSPSSRSVSSTSAVPYGAAPTPHATASWGISKSYPPVPAQVLAVACPSSTVCYAVGQNNNGTGAILSLSSTSVTTWVADTIPSGTNQINAIACPSSTVCYAVGQNSNGTATILSLSSTGTSPPSWVADTIPSGTNQINAIACPSTSV
ncbi:MAG: hypothetical protein M1522_09795, partial [Actinobacteria bacterium]|nr:hypothetical protein [Actinomycetota bacterium]